MTGSTPIQSKSEKLSNAISRQLSIGTENVKVSDKTKNQFSTKKHTVYKLVDNNNTVQYVGRTVNLEKRENAHKTNPFRKDLQLRVIKNNLTYEEARGVEQTYMLYYHTVNTLNKMNNQINGISLFNPSLDNYMIAAEGVLGYQWNQVSNEILYWSGR